MDIRDFLAKIRTLPFVSAKLVEGIFSGNYRSVFRGPGLEFDEVREYSYGDDARIIDWNVSSRMGSPYTKTFREERELVLFFIVDTSASLNFGSGDLNKADIITILTAIMAYSAAGNNDRVGAVFFSDTIERWVPPMKGRKHVASLIQDMITEQPKGKGTELGLALKTVSESLKRRGICIILSDFKTATGMKELTILSRRHDVIAMKVFDPLDSEYPEGGLTELEDPESGQIIHGYGGSKKFRKEYSDHWKANDFFWERDYRKRGVDVVKISTLEDPVQKLLTFFSRRKGKK